MAREFRIRLSDDLSEADIYLAIRERANELMMEGDLRCWLKIDVEAIEPKLLYDDDKIADLIEDDKIADLIEERDKVDDGIRYTLKDAIELAKSLLEDDIKMDMIDDYLEEKYEEQDKHITLTDIKDYIDKDIKKGDK